jgi:HEAT repeat protein
VGGDYGKIAEGLAAFAKDKKFSLRGTALQTLGQLGTHARKAMPMLLDLLKEKDEGSLRYLAAGLVLNMAPDNRDAIDLLVEMIQATPPNQNFSPPKVGPAAIPVLAPLLLDKREDVRTRAVMTLAAMLPESPQAVPLLVKMLESDNLAVVNTAAGALATLGPKAKLALGAVRKQLGKGPPPFTYALLSLASRLGDEGLQLVQKATGDPKLRDIAVGVLIERRDRSRPTLNTLVVSLKAKALPLRLAAAKALLGLGEETGDALKALDGLMTDPEVTVRRQVISVLADAAPSVPGAVPILVKALKDTDRYAPLVGNQGPLSVWIGAVQGLGRAGAGAKEAVPAAKEYLASGSPHERAMAAWLLGEIGPAAKDTVPALKKALKDTPDVRLAAAISLAKIVPGDADALPVLLAAVKDEEGASDTPSPAMQALARLGGAAVPALAERLKARGTPGPTVFSDEGNENVLAALVAARVLALAGPDAAAAVPELLATLNDRDLERRIGPTPLRATAAWALGRVGPKASGATPALQKIAGDGSESIALRMAAAEAASRIDARIDISAPLKELLHAALVTPGASLDSFAFARHSTSARVLVPALARAMTDDTRAPIVRAQAALLLETLGDRAKEVLPKLRDALAHPATRLPAALALYKIEQDRPAGIKRLITALEADAPSAELLDGTRRINARVEAVTRLGEAGKQASAALAVLEKLEHDADAQVREAAVKAKKQIGEEGK